MIYFILFELVENIFSESYVYFYFKCDINYSFHLLSCIYILYKFVIKKNKLFLLI